MKTPLAPSLAPGSRMLIRWVGPPVHERQPVDGLPAVLRIWRDCVACGDAFDASKEHLVVIGANRALHFIGWHLVAMGGSGSVTYTWRDVLRGALLMDADAVLLVHNHPSGGLSPSADDLRTTVEMKRQCAAVGLHFIGHAIVNSDGSEGFDIEPDPAAKAPQASAAEATVTHEGQAARVRLSIPRAWLRGVGWPDGVQSCLYQELRGVNTAAELAKAWNARGYWGLRFYYKQHSTYRLRAEREFILAGTDLEKIREAAAMVGVSADDMLAAFVGRVCSNLSDRTRAAALAHAAAGEKVIAFRPVHSNA